MRKSSKSTRAKFDHRNLIAPGASIYMIGLNSGTSGDGLDAALVRFEKNKAPEILITETYRYEKKVRDDIIACGELDFVDGLRWLELDFELGHIIGRYAKRFLSRIKKAGHKADLIGSHGQTIRHLPSGFKHTLTLQVGDPSCIAQITGLPVVADFRRSDMAAGGQGAPLSPLLHERLFRHEKRWRAIVNIGGIANITVLPPAKLRWLPLAGDCGPGNMAIDLAMKKLFNRAFDKHGRVALAGNPHEKLVSQVLRRGFFKLSAPKSTGREQFGRIFVDEILEKSGRDSEEDVVSTITELTVRGIADFLNRFAGKTEEIYLCGGGAKNDYIVSRLRQIFQGKELTTTAALGYDPDYLEAVLWAYLAFCFMIKRPVDSSRYTGSTKPYIPGKLCFS
jgi:anhydro-N-acetylmuramic acid kinase